MDLKTKNALAPSKPHPAQKLTDGMLLHMTLSSHCCDANGVIFVNLCNSCMLDLKRNKTPKLLLAKWDVDRGHSTGIESTYTSRMHLGHLLFSSGIYC